MKKETYKTLAGMYEDLMAGRGVKDFDLIVTMLKALLEMNEELKKGRS